MKKIRLTAFIALCIVISSVSFAAIDVYQFDDAQQEQQFHELGKLLRCPKCQNQNIADSNAQLAKTLRQKAYEMTKEGKSKEQVVDYMVARFGDFVVYQPPVNAATIFLWLGPILLILFGFIMVWFNAKGRSNSEMTAVDEQRLARLLDDPDKTAEPESSPASKQKPSNRKKEL